MSYKVVVEKGITGVLTSCRVPYSLAYHMSRGQSSLIVTYPLHKWARPKIGLCLVFKRLEDAVKFSFKFGGASFDLIYRCRTRSLQKVNYLWTPNYAMAKSFWEKLLKGRDIDINYIVNHPLTCSPEYILLSS